MKKSLELFNKILDDTYNVKTLYNYLDSVVQPPFDYSDLLRWQWAQSVSALDKLIHDLVRVGMVETFIQRRNPTNKFLTFTLDTNTYFQINQDPSNAHVLLEQQIMLKNSFLSFQDPDKISDALSYIWDEPHKWQKISAKLGLDEKLVRTKLRNIIIRRNQIAHEGDYSHAILDRQSILDKDVEDVLDFIKSLGISIYDLVI